MPPKRFPVVRCSVEDARREDLAEVRLLVRTIRGNRGDIGAGLKLLDLRDRRRAVRAVWRKVNAEAVAFLQQRGWGGMSTQ